MWFEIEFYLFYFAFVKEWTAQYMIQQVFEGNDFELCDLRTTLNLYLWKYKNKEDVYLWFDKCLSPEFFARLHGHLRTFYERRMIVDWDGAGDLAVLSGILGEEE